MDFSREFDLLAEQAILRLKILEDAGIREFPCRKTPDPTEARAQRSIKDIISESKGCALCKNHLMDNIDNELSERAKIVFVFDAPLSDGEAGLVQKVFEAMKLKKEEAYITCLLKCVHGPEKSDHDCAVFLKDELGVLPCRYVVIMGKRAGKLLLDEPNMGEFMELGEKLAISTHAPAEFIASKELKKEVWAHMQSVMKKL